MYIECGLELLEVMYFGIVGWSWSIVVRYIGNAKVGGSIHGDSKFNYFGFCGGIICEKRCGP